MNQTVEVRRLLVEFEEALVLQVLLVGLLGGQNHPQARLQLVTREPLLQPLEVKGILNELLVDLNEEFVALKGAEPLDPAGLGVLEGGVVGEAVDFVLLLVRLAVVILLLHCHLLLLGLHRCSLVVDSLRFHFS